MVRLLVPSRPGPNPKLDDRTFIDAVLYRAKTGIPWRDLPERFGSWKTVYNRFSNWSLRGHWTAIFKALQLEADDEGVIIDASVVRAHQDAAGGKGGSSAMRWVVLEVDSPRRSTPSSTRRGGPLHVQLTPGQQHESTVAEAIIENHARGKAFIADTGYDSDAIRNQLRSMRIKPVIHANPTRKKKPRLDRRRYAVRYRVEVFFHDLKRFRALATRFEKTSRNYLALLQVACSMIWLQDLTGGA